jgi:hypothetical protein
LEAAAQSDLRSLDGSFLSPILLLLMIPGELEGAVEESPSSAISGKENKLVTLTIQILSRSRTLKAIMKLHARMTICYYY